MALVNGMSLAGKSDGLAVISRDDLMVGARPVQSGQFSSCGSQ